MEQSWRQYARENFKSLGIKKDFCTVFDIDFEVFNEWMNGKVSSQKIQDSVKRYSLGGTK